MAKKTYILKTPVEHDGTPYEVGAWIELEPRQAEPLITVGAVEPAPGATPEKSPDKSAEKGAEKPRAAK